MYDLREEKELSSDCVDALCAYDDDYLGFCASTTDCTGLIPAGLGSEAELLSYKDVYAFPSAVALANEQKLANSENMMAKVTKVATSKQK